MKNITLTIILFTGILTTAYSNTLCCDLYHYFEATIEKIAEYDVIFIGSINKGSYIKSEISNGEVKVKVAKVFKGRLQKYETIDFSYFGAWGTRKGEKYLIFAKYGQNGKLYTNECAGSSKIHNKRIKLKMNSSDSLYNRIATETKKNINFLNSLSKQENGYVKFYFSNGQIMSEGEWKNGYPINKWKHYDKSGKLRSEGFYDFQGEKIGTWKRIYSIKNRLEITESKYIWIRKGFEIEYSTYDAKGVIIKVEYELYDLNDELVLDKKRNTFKNGNHKYYLVDDKDW